MRGRMAQLSRPVQIGLLGVILLAAVWLVLLQGHSTSSTTPESSASAPAVQTVTTSTSTSTHSSGGGSSVYHGSAPGVAGLTKAIAKAQGAVATSEQNAKTLEQKSAQASDESASSAHSSTPAAAAKAVASQPTSATRTKPAKPSAPNASKTGTPANQRRVEAELAKGETALILFWNPRGADDAAVHRAVQDLNRSRLKIAVSYAGANQVASFGTITRGVQVYGTPTLLIVNRKGQTITLTGLQGSYAIEQAISEARH